ncbi:amidase signature domain-containing protein [Aspergillus californicus]
MTEFSLPNARPYEFTFPVSRTALLLIDLQRDFLDPGGFGSVQCGDPDIFASARRIVPAIKRVLERARAMGLHIIHTREGHRPQLTDLPAAKRLRQISAPNGHHALAIGDQGPMGRLLVRGEYGHDIIDELAARPGELVIDKPGKGSFWGTTLHRDLLARGVTHVLVVGVTTECCVATTIRECNDRGYQCCLLEDCTDGFDAQMVTTAMDTICAQDGLFGFVGNGADLLSQTTEYVVPKASLEAGSCLPSIRELQMRFRAGKEDPLRLIDRVLDRIEEYLRASPAFGIWARGKREVISEVAALVDRYHYRRETPGQALPPLFGIPFGAQNNIEVAGSVTRGAWGNNLCMPRVSAPAVQSLIDAGAIVVCTMDLDQPTEHSRSSSPHSISQPARSRPHITGGYASQAAIAVKAGLVSFAIATDTLGGGQIPAALNGVVALKPTKGTISSRGVIPTCPSIDTISLMSQRPEDARAVWIQIAHHDSVDVHAKPVGSLATWHVDFRGCRNGGFRFATPPTSVLERLCSQPVRERFGKAVNGILACGGIRVDVDYGVFETASQLAALDRSGLMLEHIAAVGADHLTEAMPTMHPALQQIYKPYLVADDNQHRLLASSLWAELRDRTSLAKCLHAMRAIFDPLSSNGIDVLVVPTIPDYPTVRMMDDEPIMLNSRIGIFIRAANLLDLSVVSVQAGQIPGTGLPFGVSLFAGAGYDGKALDIAETVAAELALTM